MKKDKSLRIRESYLESKAGSNKIYYENIETLKLPRKPKECRMEGIVENEENLYERYGTYRVKLPLKTDQNIYQVQVRKHRLCMYTLFETR